MAGPTLLAAGPALLALLLAAAGVQAVVVTSAATTTAATLLVPEAQNAAAELRLAGAGAGEGEARAQLVTAACACAVAGGAPCCACRPVAAASLLPAAGNAQGDANKGGVQVLFVDEDSHDDAIKEVKGSKKPSEVPEIVSYAGYKGETLDDLPVLPRQSNFPRYPERKFPSSSEEVYFLVKSSPAVRSRADSEEDVSVWQIIPEASTTVRVRTFHSASPFGKKLHASSAWRPSAFPAAPPPPNTWPVRGDSYPYGRPRPLAPPSRPSRPVGSFFPTGPLRPSTGAGSFYPGSSLRPSGSFPPSNSFHPTNSFPPTNSFHPTNSFPPTNSFYPSGDRFPSNPPRPTRPPFVPKTTTPKTAHGVNHKLDWSTEVDDTDDKKGTNGSDGDGSYDIEKKVLTAIDKLDTEQFGR